MLRQEWPSYGEGQERGSEDTGGTRDVHHVNNKEKDKTGQLKAELW